MTPMKTSLTPFDPPRRKSQQTHGRRSANAAANGPISSKTVRHDPRITDFCSKKLQKSAISGQSAARRLQAEDLRADAARATNFSLDKFGHSSTTDCKSKTYAANHPTFFFVSPSACHFGNNLTHCAASAIVRNKQQEIIIMSARTRTYRPQLLSNKEERQNVRLKKRTHVDTFRLRLACGRAPVRKNGRNAATKLASRRRTSVDFPFREVPTPQRVFGPTFLR